VVRQALTGDRSRPLTNHQHPLDRPGGDPLDDRVGQRVGAEHDPVDAVLFEQLAPERLAER
jgi:hypothetical protein